MPDKQRRSDQASRKLFAEVQAQLERRLASSVGDLTTGHSSLAYLNWLLWHCERFAAVPSFLDAARADIVSILHAGALGMERTAYIHARSLLENLVRHCYFDSRPSLFVARQLDPEEDVRDKFADLRNEIARLPHVRPAVAVTPRSSSLFSEIDHVYQEASRFVHGSTLRYRSLYRNIRSIDMDKERTQKLDLFLQHIGETCLLLVALYHLGPYLLISQPIRRHMLRQAMSRTGRDRFLRCMEGVPLTWARHQRTAALRTSRERKQRPVFSSDGLLLGTRGSVLVANPGP